MKVKLQPYYGKVRTGLPPLVARHLRAKPQPWGSLVSSEGPGKMKLQSVPGHQFERSGMSGRIRARATHWARQVGASNESAKYCVSCDTFPSPNCMTLTVKTRLPP